jgi:hypothetical protein
MLVYVLLLVGCGLPAGKGRDRIEKPGMKWSETKRNEEL